MKKVIVTGGCGFIGSSVVNHLLDQRYDVSVIDNLSLGKNYWEKSDKKPRLHIEDIIDFGHCAALFEKIEPEIVIHLAAHHFIPFCEKSIYEAYNLNVTGTLNMLECASRVNVKKFFFASTGDVYAPSFAPHREVDTISPIYVYGQTKSLAEQMCIKYFESRLTSSSLLIGRLFNAAGPRETNPHLLPDVVRQIVNGKRHIEVGNIWPQRDFVDVTSMAGVIADLTVSATGIEIVNIGSGKPQGVGDVLRTLVSVLPFEVEVVSVPERQRPNDRPYLCPEVSRLHRLIGRSAESFTEKTAREIFAENGLV